MKDNMEITYRKATADDIEKIYEQFEENIRDFFKEEYTPKTMDYFFGNRMSKDGLKKIAGGDGTLYLAEADTEAVGFLLLFEKVSGGVSFANWFTVNKEYQGKGIGTGLLKFWEDDCLKNGVHALWLGTEEYNLDFYAKRGFVYMGKMPHGYFGAEDNYMYKDIQMPNEEAFTKMHY